MTQIAEATASPPVPPEGSNTRRDWTEERRRRAHGLIQYLLRLARPDDEARKDRAALAALRGSLRDTPADFYRAAQYVVRHLGDQASADDRWFYLVGGLFALHPQHRDRFTFGQACRMLRDDSGSMDNRFMALLTTRAEAMPRVLRQMVSLLAARGVGLDYEVLLNHLCDWDAPNNWVQKRWARDYFRDPAFAKSDDAKSTTTEENENED